MKNFKKLAAVDLRKSLRGNGCALDIAGVKAEVKLEGTFKSTEQGVPHGYHN